MTRITCVGYFETLFQHAGGWGCRNRLAWADGWSKISLAIKRTWLISRMRIEIRKSLKIIYQARHIKQSMFIKEMCDCDCSDFIFHKFFTIVLLFWKFTDVVQRNKLLTEVTIIPDDYWHWMYASCDMFRWAIFK